MCTFGPERQLIWHVGVCVALSARDMAVPLGCGRDVEAFLRQGAQNDWMPEPDVVSAHSEVVMQGLVAEQIKIMNGECLCYWF